MIKNHLKTRDSSKISIWKKIKVQIDFRSFFCSKRKKIDVRKGVFAIIVALHFGEWCCDLFYLSKFDTLFSLPFFKQINVQFLSVMKGIEVNFDLSWPLTETSENFSDCLIAWNTFVGGNCCAALVGSDFGFLIKLGSKMSSL